MKKIGLFLASFMTVLLIAGCGSSAKEQTVEGTGEGKHGDIKVEVKLKDDQIQDIKVVKQGENKVLSEPVYNQLKDTIIAGNSIDVDVVSGSSATSEGYIAAVKDAIEKSGVTLAAVKAKNEGSQSRYRSIL